MAAHLRYQVEFAPSARRELRALTPHVQERLRLRIDALAEDPRPHRAARFVGLEDGYRLRVGDYRVIYQVRDRVLVVLVVRIGHRREVYRGR